MDVFEREAREGTGLSPGSHKSYDYSGRKVQELTQMLEDRDRKIAMLEKHIHEHNISLPNWPSFYPILRLDIDNEVPARRRTFCRMVLTAWYCTIVLLVFNMIAVVVATQASNKSVTVNNDKWEEGQWVSIAWLLGIPVSFPLWFWSVYNALVTGKQSRYTMSIVGIALGLAGCIFAIIGLNGFGVAGLFLLFKAKDEKEGSVPFILILVACVMWCCKAAFLGFAIVRQIAYKQKDKKIAALTEQAAAILVKAAMDLP